jgi:lipopolysaccharide transport system ATP-binding protein
LLQHSKVLHIGKSADVITHYLQAAEPQTAGALYRHIQGSKQATIQKIKLHSSTATDPVYAVFETVKIELTYELMEHFKEIEFFLLIYSEDGECLAAIFQRDGGNLTHPSGLGGSTTLTFKNPFPPGRYLVSAGIFDTNRQFLDWVEFAEHFQVESGFEDGCAFDNRLGRFTLLPEWLA